MKVIEPLRPDWVCPVLVGREDELAKINRVLRSRGGLVLIAGEAGVGKTRLLQEYVSRARELGRITVWARPEAVTQPGGFSLIIDLLESLSVLGGTGDEASALSETLAAAAIGRSSPSIRRVAAQVRGVIAQQGVGLCVMEDLHRADELSLAVLGHLARSCGEDGVVLAWSFRSEGMTLNPALERLLAVSRRMAVVDFALSPLTREQVAGMCRALWKREVALDSISDLVERSEGIPFLVEELARSAESESGQVPATISHSVRELVAGLGDIARQVVSAAALIRGPIDTQVLATVCEMDPETVAGGLGDAVRLGILTDLDGHLGFRHAIYGEAIAERWVSVERMQMHRRIASVLASYAAGNASWAEATAEQFLAAQDVESAMPYISMAADQALQSGALEAARVRYEQLASLSIDEGGKGEALIGLGEALGRSGQFEEAALPLKAAFRKLLDAGALTRALDALHAEARFWGAITDERAIEALDAGFPLVEDGCSAERARLLVHKGDLLVRRFQRVSEGLPMLEEGRTMAESLGLAPLLCESLEALAWVALGLGDTRRASTLGADACRLADQLADDDLLVRTHSNQALRLAYEGRAVDAIQMLDRVRAKIVELGGYLLPPADHLRALILWIIGRPAEADRAAIAVEETRYAKDFGRAVRAWSAMERGHDQAALSIVDQWWNQLGGQPARQQALEDSGFFRQHASQPVLCELVVAAYGEGGADDPALGLFRRFYRESCEDGPEAMAFVSALVARALIGAGRWGEAEEILAVFQRDDRLRNFPNRYALGLELLARAAMRRGETDQALHDLRTAVEILRLAGNGSDLVRCRRLLGEALLERGETSGLTQELREARAEALELGALREANRIESVLRGLGERPRAGRPRGSGVKRGEVTRREEEVIVLVAAGASNAEVASRLFLSGKTVENHLARAQRRLGVTGRAGLAAWAAKNGLI